MSVKEKDAGRLSQGSAKTTVLAADMGGTKTDMALCSFKKGSFSVIRKAQFKNKNFDSPGDVIAAFLEKCGSVDIDGATIGVAALIEDAERASFTNLDWTVDAAELSERFGIKDISLINDLVATSWGLPLLEDDKIDTLQQGIRGDGNAILIASGTGLGEAILFNKDGSFYPSPSEGGHTDFAPSGVTQQGLLANLSVAYDHVSVERVASGPGLKNIYDFLVAGRRADPTLEGRFSIEDPSAVISEEAEKGDGFAICKRALDIFVSILGAEAGNLALKALPSGGVYIAGGIPPKIIKTLKDGAFIRAFQKKGRFSEYLSTLPVHVVLEPKAALYGAANHAYSRIKGKTLIF